MSTVLSLRRALMSSLVLATAATASCLGATPARAAGPNGFTPQAGDVYIADPGPSEVDRIPGGTGVQTVLPVDLDLPLAVAVDAHGNPWVGGLVQTAPAVLGSRVLRVPADGQPPTSVGGGWSAPHAIAFDAAGDAFVADTTNNRVVELPADGSAPSDLATNVESVVSVASDPLGNVFVADPANGVVARIPAGGGTPTTVTIPGGPAFVAVDSADDLYVGDPQHRRIVVVPANGGHQQTLTGGFTPGPMALSATGQFYVVDEDTGQVVTLGAHGQSTVVGTAVQSASDVAVYAPPPTFTADNATTTATFGSPYSFTYAATDPTAPDDVTYGVVTGSLPPGLSLDQKSGRLSGTPTTVGTFTFTVQAANVVTGALSPSTTLTVGKAPQTVTFTSPPPTHAVVGGSGYTPTARGGGSGLPVTFSIDPTATKVCALGTQGVVSFLAAGTCVVDASQAGDADHAAASVAQQRFDVALPSGSGGSGSPAPGGSGTTSAGNPTSGGAGTTRAASGGSTALAATGPELPVAPLTSGALVLVLVGGSLHLAGRRGRRS